MRATRMGGDGACSVNRLHACQLFVIQRASAGPMQSLFLKLMVAQLNQPHLTKNSDRVIFFHSLACLLDARLSLQLKVETLEES